MYYVLLGLFLLWLCIILIRALRFTPSAEKAVEAEAVHPDADVAAGNLSKMVMCKTVSYDKREEIDKVEFDKFKKLLIELYPKVHQVCDRKEIGAAGILYRWKGKSTGDATVLMSHYDVVPANEALWAKPPFDGVIENGTVWGRGTLDTKGTLCAIMEAAEHLINQGFVPEQDIYFSFSGEEEISGASTPDIVEYLKSCNIKPALVLDEGGAVVEDIFPGVLKPCAMVGIGEKGYLDLELSITGQGGHSSAPPPHSLAGILAKAAVRIEGKPFKAHLSTPVFELFNTLGRHSSFALKLVFANLWCFMPLLDFMFKRKGGELNALLRTTCAVTRMQGSKSFNVMPPHASIGLNLRLLAPDTVESAVEHLRKVVDDERISMQVIEGSNASPYADTKSAQWDKVKNVILQTWPGTIVSPYLMLGASDSRHFCRISDNVLRFSAMKLTKEELGLIHGNDERIRVETLMEAVAFYIRLMLQC